MNTILYQNILNKFPSKYIKFAFAYGSGVFKQFENEPTKSNSNMIDFVFVVDDSIKFHDENLKLNSSHYSFLKYFGPYYLARIQNDFGAACYYNTLVTLKLNEKESYLIKYGIVSEHALIRDLYDWDYLYLSGRLQKPVHIIKKPLAAVENQVNPVKTFITENKKDDSENDENFNINLNCNFDAVNNSIDLAFQTNLQNALHTALLLMPEKFTLQDLFLCIAQLSYSGDFRMIIGENKQKCYNIVVPQIDRFTELYKPYLIKESFENHLTCNFETGKLTQSLDPHTIYHHLSQLPKNLIQTMINQKFKTTHYYDLEEYIDNLTNRIDYKDIVYQAVKSIVKYTSLSQSFKGILTAGTLKTINYSMRKLKKMLK